MRVFVTGATGAIGSALVPQLVERGHDVAATARSPDKTSVVEAMGASFVVLDVLDGVAVGEAVARVQPEVIVHQATALSGTPDLRRFDRWFATTNQLRTEGTDHLLAAARATGVTRRRCPGEVDDGGSRLIKREDQAIAGVAAALGQLARRLPRRPQRRRSTGMTIDVPHSRSHPAPDRKRDWAPECKPRPHPL